MLSLIYFVIFQKLGAYPIRLWDESFFAVHAYEMWHSQSWFVSLYDGVPDFFGSKPFLMNWLQMLFIGGLGYDVVAVRLPSALAAAACVGLVFWLLRKNVSHLAAWIGALVLLCSPGFIGYHTARTGEADTLVALFLLTQFISLYYVFQTKGSAKWIWAFMASLILAFFAKAFAAFFFLPAFLIYGLIFERQTFFSLFTRWQSYAGFLVFAALVGGYFFLREAFQPGYLDYAFGWHGGRFFTPVDSHNHGFDYYFQELVRWQFSWWIALAMLSAALAFMGRNSETPIRLAAVTALGFIFFLSFSQTKTPWYDAPVFPVLAILVAIPLQQFIQYAVEHVNISYARTLMLVALFSLPVWEMFLKGQSNYPGAGARAHEIKELYLHDRLNHPEELEGLIVLAQYDYAGMLFYKYALLEKDVNIFPQKSIELADGARVLVSEEELINKLQTNYHLDTLEQFREAWVFKISDTK